MDWEVLSAIATVIGTILTFIGILIAIQAERQKGTSTKEPIQTTQFSQPEEKRANRNVVPGGGTLAEFVKQYQSINNQAGYTLPAESNKDQNGDKAHDPYAPFLYILIGVIGACGGVASIFVPYLLLQSSLLEFILYPLLVLGFLGGVIFALFMDNVFEMKKSKPYLRFPLSAITGVIGGWLGLFIVAGVVLWKSKDL